MREAMGWQDRDWAKLHDEELDALYGFRKPASRPGLSMRKVVWTSVAALTIAVAGFAYTQRPQTPRPVYGVQTQHDILYGDPTEQAGILGVCTEYVADTRGAWSCTQST